MNPDRTVLGEQIQLMAAELRKRAELIVLYVDQRRLLPEHRDIYDHCLEEVA